MSALAVEAELTPNVTNGTGEDVSINDASELSDSSATDNISTTKRRAENKTLASPPRREMRHVPSKHNKSMHLQSIGGWMRKSANLKGGLKTLNASSDSMLAVFVRSPLGRIGFTTVSGGLMVLV